MAEYQVPMPGGGRVDPPRVDPPSRGSSLEAAIKAGAISDDPGSSAERATDATPGIGEAPPADPPAQQQELLMYSQLQSGFAAASRPNNLELGLPVVFTRNISLDINKVTVDFCIKKLSCTRMDEIDLMEIKAILCFNSVLTSNIVNRRISPHVDFNRVNHCSQKIITAENILLDEAGGLYKFEDASTRSVFYDIPFSVTFDISEIDTNALTEENPEHLSCIVFPFVRSNPFLPDGTESYQSVGTMKCDLVFDNFGLSDQSNLLSQYSSPHQYRYPAWTRGVTKITDNGQPERLVQGTLDTIRNLTEASTLKVHKVPNSKVRDFRIINKVLPEFEPPAEVTTESSTANFSDLYLSHDHEKNVRIMFGIDCTEIYRRNVKFYKLIDNPRTSNQVMDQVRINRLEVFRRNTTDGSPRELIIDSDDFSTGPQFSSAASARASIRETHLQGGSPTGSKYRFFSITDKEISEFTTGKYEYSIEIEFMDSTAVWFADRNEVLRQEIEDLTSLMADLEAGGFPLENRSMERFSIDLINGPQTPENIRRLRRHINIYVNNLSILFDITESQKREMVRTLTIITHPVTGNLQGMGTLKVLMNKLLARSNTILETALSLNNEAGDSPPDGVTTPLLNTFTVRRVFNRDEELYDLTCSSNVGINYIYIGDLRTAPSSFVPQNPGPIVVTKDEWETIVSREVSKYPGISQAATVSGLTRTFEYTPGLNQNSYLSPNYIRVSDNIIKFPISEADLANYMSANATLLQRAEDHQYSDTNDPDYQNFSPDAGGAGQVVNKAAASKSVSTSSVVEAADVLEASSVFLAELDAATDAEGGEGKASDYLGDDTLFNEADSARVEFSDSATPDLDQNSEEFKYLWLMNNILQGAFSKGETTAADKTNEKLNLLNERNMIDTFSSAELFALPNHIMALAANTPDSYFVGDPRRFVRFYQNEARFNIEYNTLHRVEILTGFGAGIKDGVWTQLTQEGLDNLEGTALVRLTHYTNPSLGVEDKFKCPVFNEYFLLGDTEIQPPRIIPEQEMSSDISIRGRYVFPEYIGDYTSFLEPISSTPPLPAARTSPYRTAGTTSRYRTSGHRHEYILDENGNGIAKEVCKPGHPNVCHTHRVENFVVKPAQSLSISMEHGVPMHVHDLEERSG